MNNLKTCPFCGWGDHNINYCSGSADNYMEDAQSVLIECGNPHCPVHPFAHHGPKLIDECKNGAAFEMAAAAWNTRVESVELTTLREQVKVLREALGWLVNEMDCRDDEFGGCLFTKQDFKIARDALAQTKPKY